MNLTIPLTDQIAELKREQAMRKRVYPHLIASGKLTEIQAANQNSALAAAIDSLTRLAENGQNQLIFTGWPE